jgi:hypothetical protein
VIFMPAFRHHRTPHAVRRPRRLPVATLVAVLAAAACGDSGPPPPTPTSINIFPAQASLDAVGETRNFVANVRDQNGVAMTGQVITWSSSDPSVVSVDVNGRAEAVGNGSAVVRASTGDAVGEAPVVVDQAATSLLKVNGDAQQAAAGTDLAGPIRVQAVDRLGSPVRGASIRFEVTSGGGSISPGLAATDATGSAEAIWTLGPTAGQDQGARAAIDGTGVPGVAFTALGFAGPPAELLEIDGADQTGLAGVPLPKPLRVQIVDAFGNPFAGEVSFSVTSGGGSITPESASTGFAGIASASWTLGASLGEQTARATFGDLRWDFRATAASMAGPPVSLDAIAGDGASGPAGFLLDQPLIAVARDANGVGVQGVEVTFTPSAGTVDPAVVTTDVSGRAATSWTLGRDEGTQQVVATAGALSPATFDVDAVDPGPTCFLDPLNNAQFDITLCFVTPVSETIEAAFVNARLRWESLITGDLSDIPPNPDAHITCGGPGAPPMLGPLLDDVVIFATIEEIDGEFGVLGSAGPCRIRESNALTTVGRMRFDVADLDRLAQQGRLEDVILHEMGHVLGIGTLWSTLRFLQDPVQDTAQSPRPDTHFTGPLAIAAFDAAGGAGRTSGPKVPVENQSNSFGSLNGHWRESTMDRELMTPFLDGGGVANPLSAITVQSVADLGYTVSLTGVDAFTVPFPNGFPGLLGGSEEKIPLIDDILWMPLQVVDDETGRVVRVIPPGGR